MLSPGHDQHHRIGPSLRPGGWPLHFFVSPSGRGLPEGVGGKGLRQLQFGQGQFSGEGVVVLGYKSSQCPQPRGMGTQPAKGTLHGVFQVALVVKNPPASAGDTRDAGSIPGSGTSPREGMTTHCSILGLSWSRRSLAGCRPWGH